MANESKEVITENNKGKQQEANSDQTMQTNVGENVYVPGMSPTLGRPTQAAARIDASALDDALSSISSLRKSLKRLSKAKVIPKVQFDPSTTPLPTVPPTSDAKGKAKQAPPDAQRSGDKGVDKKSGSVVNDESPEDYNAYLLEQKAEIFQKLKDQFSEQYSSSVIMLFNYLTITGKQLQHINSQTPIFFSDAAKYKGTPLNDFGPSATPYCYGEFRQGAPQNRRISQRVPMLINAVIDGYNEMYYNLLRGNGKVSNAHLHTSVLKRYMSTMIKHYGYDAYSIIGQQWLNNKNLNGNVLLTGAFINSTLETEAERFRDLGIPIMAVVQTYTPGLHIGDEYSYICDANGNVLGCSNEGQHDFWTDKNIDLPYEGEWHGMNVNTLIELGPQRIVFINHVKPTRRVEFVPSKKDNAYKVKQVTPIALNRPQRLIGLYDEEIEDKVDEAFVPGFDPFLIYRSYDGSDRGTLWERICGGLRRLWENTHVYNWYRDFCKWLGIWPKDFNLVLNPNLCQFPDDEKGITQLYHANPIDPVTKLPYGVYYVDKNNVIQLQFGDNSANYTNLYSLFRAYAVRRGHSPASTYKYLVDYTLSLHPALIPDTEFSFQPVYESPLPPITARRPYKVEVNESPGMSVKLFSEEELREYVVNYVTHRSVSAAASWRVVRAGLRNVMPKGTLLAEYIDFWKNGVCGGYFVGIPDVDPIPDVLHFTGKKRRKYQLLLDTLGTRSMRAYYNLFCKQEALPLSNVLKKAVRIISPNNPTYNLVALNFFVSFEEKLLSAMSPHGTFYFAKGLNYEQRWETIRVLSKLFRFCYSIDFKNFDAHHCDENYEQEIEMYIRLGYPRDLARELYVARHSGVISYQALMRCSGDLFTGSGNCLTVGALLFPFVSDRMCFFCDGDDTLLFLQHKSDYEIISKHLLDRGYELGEPEIIPLNRTVNDVPNYEIPFCQVSYSYDYYTKDLDRLLNKCGNLAGSNLDQVSKTILGKLQSFPILNAHGHKFDIDLVKFLNGLDDNYELEYKKFLTQNMEHYEAVGAREISLKKGTSLLAKIARKFEYNKYRIFMTSLEKRPKLLRKLIKEVLEKELEKENAELPDEKVLGDKVAAFVRNEGIAAITPVLTTIYRDMIRENTSTIIRPPVVPHKPSPLLLSHGELYA
jgi:hypothetical protein